MFSEAALDLVTMPGIVTVWQNIISLLLNKPNPDATISKVEYHYNTLQSAYTV